METKTYFINSQGQGMDDALEGTEVLGTAAGLQRKEVLRLRWMALIVKSGDPTFCFTTFMLTIFAPFWVLKDLHTAETATFRHTND